VHNIEGLMQEEAYGSELKQKHRLKMKLKLLDVKVTGLFK
jgi:hypothetical protein